MLLILMPFCDEVVRMSLIQLSNVKLFLFLFKSLYKSLLMNKFQCIKL